MASIGLDLQEMSCYNQEGLRCGHEQCVHRKIGLLAERFRVLQVSSAPDTQDLFMLRMSPMSSISGVSVHCDWFFSVS